MSNEFLSQEEVDALLSNVTGDKPKPKDDDNNDSGPLAYDLGKQERIVRGRMATLEIINDRAARNLRQSMYSLLRKNPEITHAGVRPQKYSEWIKHLPMPASFNIIQIKGLRGNALIVLDPGLIFALIDSLFGGTGQFHTRIEGRDFSQTEQQLILRITQMLCETFTTAWRPIMPLEFQYVRGEIHAQFAAIATPSEVVLASQFKIEIAETSGNFWICFPYASIEPIKDLLSNDLQNDSERNDNRWNSVLSKKMIDTEIEISFEVARLKTTLKQITQLHPGQVLDLGDKLRVNGYCNDEHILSGEPGQTGQKMAIRVTKTHIGEKK